MALQIKNNPSLLKHLMEDMETAPDEWRPTPYWQGYVKRIYSRLQVVGLEGFRGDWEIIKGHGKFYPILPDPYRHRSLKVRSLRMLSKTPVFRQISDFYMKEVNVQHKARKNTYDQLVMAISHLLASDPIIREQMDLIGESSAGLPAAPASDLDNFTLDFLLHFSQLFVLNSTVDALKMRNVLEIGGGHGKFAEFS